MTRAGATELVGVLRAGADHDHPRPAVVVGVTGLDQVAVPVDVRAARRSVSPQTPDHHRQAPGSASRGRWRLFSADRVEQRFRGHRRRRTRPAPSRGRRRVPGSRRVGGRRPAQFRPVEGLAHGWAKPQQRSKWIVVREVRREEGRTRGRRRAPGHRLSSRLLRSRVESRSGHCPAASAAFGSRSSLSGRVSEARVSMRSRR